MGAKNSKRPKNTLSLLGMPRGRNKKMEHEQNISEGEKLAEKTSSQKQLSFEGGGVLALFLDPL